MSPTEKTLKPSEQIAEWAQRACDAREGGNPVSIERIDAIIRYLDEQHAAQASPPLTAKPFFEGLVEHQRKHGHCRCGSIGAYHYPGCLLHREGSTPEGLPPDGSSPLLSPIAEPPTCQHGMFRCEPCEFGPCGRRHDGLTECLVPMAECQSRPVPIPKRQASLVMIGPDRTVESEPPAPEAGEPEPTGSIPSADDGAETVARLGIDVPKWATEIRAKVASAIEDTERHAPHHDRGLLAIWDRYAEELDASHGEYDPLLEALNQAHNAALNYAAARVEGLINFIEERAERIGVQRACAKARTMLDGFGDEPPAVATSEPPLATAERPIQMVLPLPACHRPHIDEGEWALKLHRTHQCQHCKTEWRPAAVATVGVARLLDADPSAPQELDSEGKA